MGKDATNGERMAGPVTLLPAEMPRLRRDVAIAADSDFGVPELRRYGDVVNRFAMQRSQRSVGFYLFGRRFGYESASSQRWIETLQLTTQTNVPVAMKAPRRKISASWLALVALPVVTAAGMLSLIATARGTGERPAMVISNIAEPRPLAGMPQHDPLARAGRSTTHKSVRPDAQLVLPKGAAAAPSPAGAQRSTTTSTAPAEDNEPQPLTLAKAQAEALASGEPSYWAEGDRSGAVVVGPERPENGRLCRSVAIFTRVNGSGGEAQSWSKCRDVGTKAN